MNSPKCNLMKGSVTEKCCKSHLKITELERNSSLFIYLFILFAPYGDIKVSDYRLFPLMEEKSHNSSSSLSVIRFSMHSLQDLLPWQCVCMVIHVSSCEIHEGNLDETAPSQSNVYVTVNLLQLWLWISS